MAMAGCRWWRGCDRAVSVLHPARNAAGVHATVDDELRPRHIPRGVGRQIQYALCNFDRLAGTAERGCHLGALLRIDRRVLSSTSRFRRDLAPDRGVDDARMHRVDPDAITERG